MKTSIWGNFPWETGYTSAGGGRFWSSSVSRSSAVWGESHLLWGEDDISVICTLTAWHLSNLGGMGHRRKETWKQFEIISVSRWTRAPCRPSWARTRPRRRRRGRSVPRRCPDRGCSHGLEICRSSSLSPAECRSEIFSSWDDMYN